MAQITETIQAARITLSIRTMRPIRITLVTAPAPPAASAWHRGGVCPQLEILQKGVDLLPVTRYNVARNKEVMGCHPKAGPSISKIVGLNSSLLLWKSNAKKWRRSSGSYKKDRNPKRNGSTKRLMKNSANKNPPRCSSLATGRHGGCTPNTQGLFYPLEAG